MNQSKLLVAVVVLQGLTLAGVWSSNSASQLPAANAQVVDPGAQRLQMVEQQRETNAKLDKIAELLKGELQVRVVTPDDSSKPAPKGK